MYFLIYCNKVNIRYLRRIGKLYLLVDLIELNYFVVPKLDEWNKLCEDLIKEEVLIKV